MSDAEKSQEQRSIAARLQLLLLLDFEEQFKSKTITSADRATLARLLMQNGWSIDPKDVPQGLKDKLTTRMSPEDFGEDDGVVGRIA